MTSTMMVKCFCEYSKQRISPFFGKTGGSFDISILSMKRSDFFTKFRSNFLDINNIVFNLHHIHVYDQISNSIIYHSELDSTRYFLLSRVRFRMIYFSSRLRLWTRTDPERYYFLNIKCGVVGRQLKRVRWRGTHDNGARVQRDREMKWQRGVLGTWCAHWGRRRVFGKSVMGSLEKILLFFLKKRCAH